MRGGIQGAVYLVQPDLGLRKSGVAHQSGSFVLKVVSIVKVRFGRAQYPEMVEALRKKWVQRAAGMEEIIWLWKEK